tara:strand:+ start:3475 stop:3723 length:249 start_codon:yes stop_codon:yes gene_type:complete
MFDIEGLQRHVEENPLNLTNMELQERKEAVDQQVAKHPDVPPQWVEMLWNFLHKRTEQECRDMVNNGELFAEKKNDEQEETQ